MLTPVELKRMKSFDYHRVTQKATLTMLSTREKRPVARSNGLSSCFEISLLNPRSETGARIPAMRRIIGHSFNAPTETISDPIDSHVCIS
jgi:hypothetical protein